MMKKFKGYRYFITLKEYASTLVLMEELMVLTQIEHLFEFLKCILILLLVLVQREDELSNKTSCQEL